VTSGSERAATLAADGLLLLATAIWGLSFVVVRWLLGEVSPLLFVALRFTVAALVLLPVVVRGPGIARPDVVRAGSIVGFWLGLGFALQTVGLETTEPGRAAFLTGVTVVLVPLFLLLLYRRAPSGGALVGVALATAGLFLLTGPSGGGFSPGDLLVLLAAAAFALQVLAVDRHARRIPPFALLFWEVAVSASLAWPAAFVLEVPRWPVSALALAAIAGSALLATIFALWAQIVAQRVSPPTRVAVILSTEPVFAAAVSYAFTGERLGPAGLVGCALILAGMLAAELLPSRFAPREGGC
jgi:drug/metabolite transporter (DMT)-like permease